MIAETAKQMRVLLVLVLASVGCASQDSGVTRRQQCVELRDHLVDLRLAGTTEDVAAHRDVLQRSLGDGFLARCEELSAEELRCKRAAKDLTSARACSSVASR